MNQNQFLPRFRQFPLILLLLLLLTATSVTVAAAGRSHTEYGPAVAMGDGSIQAYITLKGDNKPAEIGIQVDGAALSGLPAETAPPSDGTWDILDAAGNVVWPCCGYEHLLELPAAAAVTPFEHIVVNWNNHGHPPPAIYDKPHFDFHFYTISNDERTSIAAPTAVEMCNEMTPLTCAAAETALRPLPEAQTPPDYFAPGAVEPGMGNHMLDMTAPELAGAPFTQTWIYGTWDGKISFFEPMITLEYLQNLEGKVCYNIKTPAAFAEEGYYPTRYCTFYHPGKDIYRITLNRFEWFGAD